MSKVMFTHLHIHTEYSLLDGMCRIPQLIQSVKELGMDSLAITDHGALYGIVQFYLQAKEAGIKPIIGCELYLAHGRCTSRTPAEKSPYHLVVLARNETGYRNLLKLSSIAWLEGFYHKPRVDKELLKQHHEGLIALSGCLNGELPRLIQEGRRKDAEKVAKWYKEVFGHFYLELQHHDIPEQHQVNEVFIDMSKELDIPLVATNDTHYIYKHEAPIQDVLMCIQTNNTIYNQKRPRMGDDSFYLRSPQEMTEIFAKYPEAIENTERIAEMCELELDFGRLHLPRIDIPTNKTSDEYLADLCGRDFVTRYPGAPAEAKGRLTYELEVIEKTEFADYFLVVWELISWIRSQGILFGVRGSAAASVVLYCLGITDIDPLSHHLVFERFLNVERREMPDIDLDFQDDRRDEVIRYVAQRYGPDRVAQIITFGTLGARAALRDVGRSLGMPYAEVDSVARLVPVGSTLSDAIQNVAGLRSLYRSDERIRNLIDTAMKLEGIARHASTHAAGVVISDEPLVEHIPLQRPAGGNDQGLPTTQLEMGDIARIGLLKMDFLGLANLTILEKAKRIIAERTNADIDVNKIPLDDRKTFELLSAGETTGVFQLEGSGMKRYIRELKPDNFSDIASMVALYRPGPKEHIPAFIAAKHRQIPVEFPHPALEEILKETYGVIVYQDQVLLITQTFAGYSLSEADIVRKAMGKKDPEIMKDERHRFIAGATTKGFSAKVAQDVFSLIEPFAGYAFNKAHATSYAMIAYQTAYLKANYPTEFMTALLISYMGNQEKIATAVAECERWGIKVLPPDVNRSKITFTVDRDEQGSWGIRFGLAAIKNVGEAVVEPIVACQEEGPFNSLGDFCRRADLRGMNRRTLESLIKAGALDSLGHRGALLGGIDRILKLSQQEQQLKASQQATMFDLLGDNISIPAQEPENMEIPKSELLAWEKDLLGIYLSAHPLHSIAKNLTGLSVLCGQIDEEMAGQEVAVVGMVTSARRGTTRNNRPFVSAVLEDIAGQIEVTAWPEVYEKTEGLWEEGNILSLRGKVSVRGEGVQLVCKDATSYSVEMEQVPWEIPSTSNTCHHEVTISITQSDDIESDLSKLRQVLDVIEGSPGKDKLYLTINSGDGITMMDFPDKGISYSQALHQQLSGLVGDEGVNVD